MKIWSATFGCKVNQYETELLRQRMSNGGNQFVPSPIDADLCLINSCSVTAFADKECRQMIRMVLRSNPHARVIVTGCYATRSPQELKTISDRVEVYSNAEKDSLPSCLGFEISDQPLGIHQFSGRTRAFLKIQDGCQAPCRYCIIPTVRSTLWSKPVRDVTAEFQALLANGYQEIVLTGIRLGLYRGNGQEKVDLVGLLRLLVALPGTFRIRLSSLEVTEVSAALVSFVKDNPKICRHFHIPLQSGDDQVLRSMGRWYGSAAYRKRVDLIKGALPDAGITADVMVGYPTETDDLFENTYRFIDEIDLSGLHVFRFSARAGTKAASLEPLDPRVVSRRAARLGALDQALKSRFYQRFQGTLREAILEPTGEGWTDNYIRIQAPEGMTKTGLALVPVWSASEERGEGALKPHRMKSTQSTAAE